VGFVGGREKRFELGHFESHWGDWQWRNTPEDRDTSFRSEYVNVIVVYRTGFEREKGCFVELHIRKELEFEWS
jgi:hypothetical protein